MIQSNLIDMENMFDLLDVEPEMVDAPDARDLVLDEKTNGCSVEFDHVSFGYSPRKQILHDVSFKIGAGETLAIVGTTGSGKSTIMRLLFRFYDLQSGAIRVNGQDVSKLTQTSLRRAMGVVPQDTVLFNDHIKYNIKYGDVNASDEKVIEAANAAEIHDAIERFPDGYVLGHMRVAVCVVWVVEGWVGVGLGLGESFDELISCCCRSWLPKVRHCRWRAWAQAEWRRETENRHRPHDFESASDYPSRRSDIGIGHGDREEYPGATQPASHPSL